jgi:hypothetical protein
MDRRSVGACACGIALLGALTVAACGGSNSSSVAAPVSMANASYCEEGKLFLPGALIPPGPSPDGGAPGVPSATIAPGPTPLSAALDALARDAAAPFSNKELRQRAAVVCACRAQRNRKHSTTSGAASDVLVVLGGLATGTSAALTGVASTIEDSDRRKSYGHAGIISLASATAFFGIAAALALTKRTVESASGAEDQEFAAAVLWDDHAGAAAWSRAWAACARGESLTAAARPESPHQVFQDATRTAPDAGVGGTPDSGLQTSTADSELPRADAGGE